MGKNSYAYESILDGIKKQELTISEIDDTITKLNGKRETHQLLLDTLVSKEKELRPSTPANSKDSNNEHLEDFILATYKKFDTLDGVQIPEVMSYCIENGFHTHHYQVSEITKSLVEQGILTQLNPHQKKFKKYRIADIKVNF